MHNAFKRHSCWVADATGKQHDIGFLVADEEEEWAIGVKGLLCLHAASFASARHRTGGRRFGTLFIDSDERLMNTLPINSCSSNRFGLAIPLKSARSRSKAAVMPTFFKA